MNQRIVHVALVVRDYDEAIAFYTQKLRFTLVEDTYQPAQDKRWVVVAPPGNAGGTTLLLARASTAEQARFVGDQTGGRVFLFLETDDFGATTRRCPRLASRSSARPASSRMVWSRCSRICTAIGGISLEYRDTTAPPNG